MEEESMKKLSFICSIVTCLFFQNFHAQLQKIIVSHIIKNKKKIAQPFKTTKPLPESVKKKALTIPPYYHGAPFKLVSFENNEKSLVIIIPTYNNVKWYDKNLQSIFDQKYSNYRVIIIDDHSTDGTPDLIEKYIQKHHQENRCVLIRNQTRQYKMANLYKTIHTCDDHEIVIIVDGDDWLLDDRAFSYFNELYSSSDIWLTVGGYQEYPSGNEGFCRPIPTEIIEQNKFREYPRTTSQLRTFYAGLFKKIKKEELMFEGEFFKAASDVAKMMPMFEMAGERIAFNYRKVYVYNLANELNDHKIHRDLQHRSAKYILNRRTLKRIDSYIN